MKTALIVPAATDVAGKCRIVIRDGNPRNALQDYRADPDAWQEVGWMDSRGHLLCCEPVGDLAEQLRDSEPLMAGTAFAVKVETESESGGRGDAPRG